MNPIPTNLSTPSSLPNASDAPDIQMVGSSDAIRAVDADIDSAARSDAKVLITGETGVGKEIVATLLHRRSARRRQRFVTLNCAGIPESLLESELFGHVKGSFTGAHRDRIGLLEMAAHGTVFLDEVGEMGLRMQAVLLRFLQSGEIQRVGALKPHARVNVRLIAATNRDLKTQISAGAFREDFYFRLNVISIAIPPLRERLEDIPALADHFLNELGPQQGRSISLAPETLQVLQRYQWPGNIRELRNVIERSVVKARGTVVMPQDLPPPILAAIAAATHGGQGTVGGHSIVGFNESTARMLERGESFWSALAPHVVSGAVSREDLRAVVQLGLDRTQGSFRNLVSLFNMRDDDHIRFREFLRAHDCHLPRRGLKATRPPRRKAPAP